MKRLAAALLALLVLSGCGALGALDSTRKALRAGGYDVRGINYTSSDAGSTLTVTWRPRARSREELAQEEHNVAVVVWGITPFRFDLLKLVEVRIAVPGFSSSEFELFPHEQLVAELGPRPRGLDDTSFADHIDVRATVAVVAAIGLVGLGAIVLIVVLVIRTRRPRAPYPPQAWWPPPPSQ